MSILSKLQSLLTAANATTGESDTTLTDAMQTLVDGYGQGGGGSGIGVDNTPIPNILNMFYALEHGTAVTNTFTLSQTIPNTETLIFETGLSTVHGIFIADESQATLNTANVPESVLFAIVFNPTSEGTGDYAFTRANNVMEYASGTSGISKIFLTRCTWSVRNGSLYCTGDYNRHTSYTPFQANHTYRWVAW